MAPANRRVLAETLSVCAAIHRSYGWEPVLEGSTELHEDPALAAIVPLCQTAGGAAKELKV